MTGLTSSPFCAMAMAGSKIRWRGARGDGNSIRGSNLRLDAAPSPIERRECQRREPSALIRNQHWKRRKRRIVPPLAWARASHCRAFDSGSCPTPHPSNAMAHARAHATCAQGRCVLRGRARRGCRSGASLLGAAFEQRAAGGAEVAAVMGHARPDTIDIRDVLLAEPHRIRFAGRALLRRPLLRGGRPRREREREAHERGRERGGGHDRPELRLCDTNFHYRPSSWHSVPVSTVNPTSMASSAPCWRESYETEAIARVETQYRWLMGSSSAGNSVI